VVGRGIRPQNRCKVFGTSLHPPTVKASKQLAGGTNGTMVRYIAVRLMGRVMSPTAKTPVVSVSLVREGRGVMTRRTGGSGDGVEIHTCKQEWVGKR